MDCPHGVEVPEGGWSLPEGVYDPWGEFYMACDCCDYPMSHACAEIYHNQETGETLCTICEPKAESGG